MIESKHSFFVFNIFNLIIDQQNDFYLFATISPLFDAVSVNCIRSADQRALEALADIKFKIIHLLSIFVSLFICTAFHLTCHQQRHRLIYYLTTQARTILQSLSIFAFTFCLSPREVRSLYLSPFPLVKFNMINNVF